MSFNRTTEQLHEEYEQASQDVRDAIDAAYTAARKELEARGFTCASDDTAEVFVAAIYQYFLDSAEAS